MAVFVGLDINNPFNPGSSTAQSIVKMTNPVANGLDATAKAFDQKSGLRGAVSNFIDNSVVGQVIKNVPAAIDAADKALGGDGFFYEGVDPITSPNHPAAPTNPVTSVPSDGGTTVPVPTEYLYADFAKAYGMDASTAYQEALSNTSYQRAVADLQRAGLNPILATGQGASTGVYGAQLAGSGQVSNGVSTAKSAHTWYNILSNVGEAVGAVVGKGYVGSKAGKAIGTVLGNLIDGFY